MLLTAALAPVAVPSFGVNPLRHNSYSVDKGANLCHKLLLDIKNGDGGVMLENIPVLRQADLDAYLGNVDVVAALEQVFAALHKGLVTQPPQTLTLFPQERGDFITYLGVLGHVDIFGAKLSPYIPTGAGPIITAWTMLMSMKTGLPLLLCDSGSLTTERTAATTCLAVKKLARSEASVLAVIGSGAIAFAHIRYALTVRQWSEIRVFSPGLAAKPERQSALKALDGRVRIAANAPDCIRGADVVMLATSSGKPVIDPADIGKNALITSISTNVARAHELDPALLPTMAVYCDFKATTPESAGEMVLAEESGQWSRERIKGDLADLCAGAVSAPDYEKPVFFRSIGLGIEDVAIAYAIYKQISG